MKEKLYELLDDNQKVIQDIVDYFIIQGFYYTRNDIRNPLNPAIPSATEHILIFGSDLVRIEINDKSYKIILKMHDTNYELKVNGKALEDLSRIINSNIDKINYKNSLKAD